MVTGQDDDVPTGKAAAIDRIQAMRANIRPSRPRQNSGPVETSEAAASSETAFDEATSPDAGPPVDDADAALAQRDATISALRAEIAALRQEVAAIAGRLAPLGLDDGEDSSGG